MSRSRRRARGLAVLVVLVLGNVPPALHARAMLRFVPAGERTPPPEELDAIGRIRVILSGVRIPRPVSRLEPSAPGLRATDHPVPARDGGRAVRRQQDIWQIAYRMIRFNRFRRKNICRNR